MGCAGLLVVGRWVRLEASNRDIVDRVKPESGVESIRYSIPSFLERGLRTFFNKIIRSLPFNKL